MILGVFTFFSSEGLLVADKIIKNIFFYIIFNIPITIPASVNIGSLFLVLWGGFWICWIIGWGGPEESFIKTISNGLSQPLTRIFRNFLFTMPLATAMLLLAELFILSLQETHGIPTGSLDIPNPYELFFFASYASISEEIGFRMFPIGSVAAFWVLAKCWSSACNISIGAKFKLAIYSVLYPEGVKAKLNLKRVNMNGVIRGISAPEWMIVLISAFIFGLAHVLAGSGWLIGKLTITFVLGVFLGIIYLTYGITASILIHWFFNFYLTSFWLAYDMFGYPIKFFINLSEILILGFGFVGWIGFAIYLILKVANKLTIIRFLSSDS